MSSQRVDPEMRRPPAVLVRGSHGRSRQSNSISRRSASAPSGSRYQTVSPRSHIGSGSASDDVVIAVMGVTGAGKSSFIAKVTRRSDIAVGHSLNSETSDVRSYPFHHGLHNYVLVDTPGFDDQTMSNNDITKKLLGWLESSYRRGQRLNGIIYIHNITKPRMQGSAYQNIRMFRNLCGDDALENVILATSFWDQVEPSLGERRERELVDSKDFWADMVAKKSRVVRLTLRRSDCLKLLEQIAGNSKRDLLVQQELVTENRAMEDTTLGRQTMDAEVERVDMELRREREAERDRWKVKLEERDKLQKKELKKVKSEHEGRMRELRESQNRVQSDFEREMRENKEQMRRERQQMQYTPQQYTPQQYRFENDMYDDDCCCCCGCCD